MNNLPIIGGSIAAVVAGIIVAVFTLFPTSTISGEYGLMVDPTKEKQTLFIMARVAIENTGTLPLTNVEVNYGDGDIEVMHMLWTLLKPGKEMLLTIPVGKDRVFAPKHRIYGAKRLPRLLQGWEIVKSEYWGKDESNRWRMCEEIVALEREPLDHYYGLGLFVIRRPEREILS